MQKKIREKMLRLCGDRSIGEANLRKGLAPSMEAALPPATVAD